MRVCLSNHQGFTLIEVVAAMVIIGVITSVSVQKFEGLSGTATQKAISEGVRELNIRERLAWINSKLSSTGYTNDDDLFSALNANIGGDFKWASEPNATGGTLMFRSTSIVLNRTRSTPESPGNWQ